MRGRKPWSSLSLEDRKELKKQKQREKWNSDIDFRERQNAKRREAYKNSDSQKQRLKENRKELLKTPEGRIKCNLWTRKHWAKKNNIEFDLTVEDLLPLPTHCPALGIELDYGFKGAIYPNSPSLDRINPNKGYIKDNVIIVSNRANVIKQNASVEEIKAVANFYERFNDER